MWLMAMYQPVGLFSLKVGEATSTGAKTLFLPTPFAIRTALLDAAIRTRGLEAGTEAFEMVRDVTIAAFPPKQVVVTNLFTKVLKPRRSDTESEEAMQRTIAFREYAYLTGALGLAFEGDQTILSQLRELLYQINYFGKRGSFFQLLTPPELVEELPEGFVVLKGITPSNDESISRQASSFPLGIIQPMDDWGPGLSFEKVNIYTDENISLGKDRIREYVILPYRLAKSSRSFSYYERM